MTDTPNEEKPVTKLPVLKMTVRRLQQMHRPPLCYAQDITKKEAFIDKRSRFLANQRAFLAALEERMQHLGVNYKPS